MREPVTAGTFYEQDRESLIRSIKQCFLGGLGPGRLPQVADQRTGRIKGLVCPHAGYIYSGSAAAYAYDCLASDGLPDTVVLLGPNHTGLGASVAVSTQSEWSTPLGIMRVDAVIANAILSSSKYAEPDNLAHAREHSLEVQLPFLQYLEINCQLTTTQIVPISIAHLDMEDAVVLSVDLGDAIAKALEDRSAVVIASTDFTHYEPASVAQVQDSMAIDQILKLDSAGLLQTVYGKHITMCGVIGTAVMIEACRALGAVAADKLTYYTSGDVTGDKDQVVGYAALSITL